MVPLNPGKKKEEWWKWRLLFVRAFSRKACLIKVRLRTRERKALKYNLQGPWQKVLRYGFNRSIIRLLGKLGT